jgi:PKD repeat protein
VTNAKGTDTLTRPDYIGVIFTANDGIAIFRPSTGYWYFDNNLDAIINSSFRYGGSTDQIIKGDWQGTGRDGIAIFRPSTGYWYFDYDLNGIIDKFFRYGGSTDQIIKGDWQGTGSDGIAIFRPSTGYWYFDYNLDGVVDKSFRYGGSTDRIIVGKWNSTLQDGIAIFRPSTGYWYFDYNLDGVVDKFFRYGGSTDQIIKGDWDGDGKDGIAIFRPSTGYWYFDHTLDGVVDKSFRYGGSTDQIIMGDWQGTGRDGIAIFRPSTGYWYFDNYLDGIVDKSFRYGGSTDRIIAGKWNSVAPTAAFISDLQNGTAPLTVRFTGQSTGSAPLTYAWDFDNDGVTDSTAQSPSYIYAAAGTYTVNLTVTNIVGSNSTVKTDYIMVNPPPTIILAPTSLTSPITVDTLYSQLITASGGTAPYSFNLTTGTLPTNLTLSAGGTISGTPNATGTSAFAITATDVNNFTGTQSYSLTVTPPTIILAPTSLTSPIPVDTLYSQLITASGGTAPYTYSISSGALPTNLTLSATTGTISGTPTAIGLSAFNITATDNNTYTGTRSYSLTVTPPTITLSPASLPTGVGSNAYSQTISASGGTAPYTYSVTSGVLPTGLSLTGDTISGTPTAAGSFNFNITATDVKTYNGTRSYSLTVTPPTITLSPDNLPPIPWNISYSETITASGGMEPYTYSVTTGTLPTGLSLSTGGIISGTPTATGTFPFTITAIDTNSFTGTQSYSLTVVPPTFPLSPSTLPDAPVNVEYNQTITAFGGVAPYSYSVTSGALPNELSLSTDGILSGTPTAPGVFAFSITATDARTFTGSAAYILTVNS